jgi:hypothetical protein
METTQQKAPERIRKITPPESDPTKIDRNAKNLLSVEGVRVGHPSTDDSVMEAMDEETPGLAGN